MILAKKTAEEKIKCVLDLIKDQYDLGPKATTRVEFGYVIQSYPAGEMRFMTETIYEEYGITFDELQRILGRLKEDGLIARFEIVSDYA